MASLEPDLKGVEDLLTLGLGAARVRDLVVLHALLRERDDRIGSPDAREDIGASEHERPDPGAQRLEARFSGHAPEADEGTELIQFSPSDQLAEVEAAIANAMAG